MKYKTSHFILLFCIAILFMYCNACRITPLYDIHKSATGKNGMVVTVHPLATEIGLNILKQGGNAADASIAVQFALAVVYPRAGNIGGGGFLVYHKADGEIISLDYRERAPLSAYRDMYLDSTGNVIEGLSREGILAAGIPGTVGGLEEMYTSLSKLHDWPALIQPAIQLAENGFKITKAEADRLNEFHDLFTRLNPPEMPFLSEKKWKAGDRLVQKELAATLSLIAQKGSSGFYDGSNADRLESFSKSRNGFITKSDLLSYKAKWRKPIHTHWREYDIYSMGLPSSGGIVMGQILKMIENKLVDSLGYRDPYNIHLIIEAERRAYADRALYLGDEDYFHVPVDSILSSAYIKDRFSDFNENHASSSGTGDSAFYKFSKEHFETTHLSIVDGEGNAASVTTTLNDNYGCKIWVPGGGYFLNNEMDDFSCKPGVPNLFGLIGAEANAICPGKRMLSSMTPTLVKKDGKLWMVLGTPGGSTIITSVLQVFLNVAAYGMNIDTAVQSSRFHHQWLPDEIMHEKNAFSPGLIDSLTKMGYKLRALEALGLIEAVMLDNDGVLHGAADRRSDDHAAGY
ncbi:MAG TPA: gamma-glutamyltransferase [Saprospiraceae bacterium]|nr:gamma-glutamyltransferase [Saprospiraceae bacterium]